MAEPCTLWRRDGGTGQGRTGRRLAGRGAAQKSHGVEPACQAARFHEESKGGTEPRQPPAGTISINRSRGLPQYGQTTPGGASESPEAAKLGSDVSEAVGATGWSSSRAWARRVLRWRLLRNPKWRILTKPLGNRCRQKRRTNSPTPNVMVLPRAPSA